MIDYIPQRDEELHAWQGNFITTLELKASEWGIPEEQVECVKVKQGNWISAYRKASNRKLISVGDIIAKQIAREKLKRALRPIITNWLSENSKITNTDFQDLGLNIGLKGYKLAPIPKSAPIGIVDFSLKYKHSIHYCDQNIAFREEQPEGVVGCEIYMKLGGNAPKDISEMINMGVSSSSPHIIKFDTNERGSFVYYWLRWVNKYGECGPWSETISSMVK